MRNMAASLFGLCIAFHLAVAHSQQSWPARPISMVVSNPPGSVVDLGARVVAEALASRLGQAVTVDDRPGGDGWVGALAAARSSPDGYTVYMASASVLAIEVHLRKSMPIDPVRDFTPVAVIAESSGRFSIMAYAASPFKNLPELVAYARQNPGKVTFASAVPIFSMFGDWLNRRAQIEAVEVPYKTNAQAIQDAIAGRVSVIMSAFVTLEPYLKSGQLRAIAISPNRLEAYPELGTVAEAFPGFTMNTWVVLVGPSGIPEAIIGRLNHEVNAVLAEPKVAEGLGKLDWSSTGGPRTPQQTAEFIKLERDRYGEFFKFIGRSPQ